MRAAADVTECGCEKTAPGMGTLIKTLLHGSKFSLLCGYFLSFPLANAARGIYENFERILLHFLFHVGLNIVHQMHVEYIGNFHKENIFHLQIHR